MSRRKTERLLGLVVCLLSTSRYLTAEHIRRAVGGYPDSDEAFKRMFERDKEELRELGIPLQTGRAGPFDEDEVGYRVNRRAYELPELRLEADEVAVLGLAARVWRHAELAEAAAGALLKLRAAGIETEDVGSAGRFGVEPRLRTAEPAFGPLWQAVRDGRVVTFGYRAAGQGESRRRELEPWGVVNRRGHWYVVGRDRVRGAVRVFRLSRIEGRVAAVGPAGSVTVPVGVDVRELVRQRDLSPVARCDAVLRVRSGTGLGLRRHAGRRPADDPRSAGADGGWDEITVPLTDVTWLADEIASFGADVVVLDPPDLRDAVIRKLKGVLA